MALDWETAEGYTRGLSRDETSRLSTLPRDVVDTIAPYLHTYTLEGCPYRNWKIHGTQVHINSDYVGVREMCDGELHGVCKWWRADGSMHAYTEYDMGRLLILHIDAHCSLFVHKHYIYSPIILKFYMAIAP